MKIYIAHNYSARETLVEYVVPLFVEAGFQITSQWLTVDQKAMQHEDAQMDFDDIDKADALLFFYDQYGPTPGRGKYVELGYALAKKKPVYVIDGFHEKKKSFNCVFVALAARFFESPKVFAEWCKTEGLISKA